MTVIESANKAPSPRVGHSLGSFSNGKKMVLFGGASFEEGYTNDVWIYELSTHTWTRMTPSISSIERSKSGELLFPPPRYEHTGAVFQERWLIIFGGCGNDGLLNDLWILDLRTWIYSKIHTMESTPCPRIIQSGVLVRKEKREKNDEVDSGCLEECQLVIFGGASNESVPVNDDKLHIFDFESRSWESITTLGPCCRYGHSMDAFGSRLILIGGIGECKSFSDIWIFHLDEKIWRQITVPEGQDRPKERGGHVSAITTDGLVYLHGGMRKFDSDNSPAIEILGDTWMFSIEKSEWIQIIDGEKEGDVPIGSLVDHSMAKSLDNAYIFGGMNEAGVYNRMFRLSLGAL